jgi:hypothetical protein
LGRIRNNTLKIKKKIPKLYFVLNKTHPRQPKQYRFCYNGIFYKNFD